MLRYDFCPTDPEYIPVAGPCEHGNEPQRCKMVANFFFSLIRQILISQIELHSQILNPYFLILLSAQVGTQAISCLLACLPAQIPLAVTPTTEETHENLFNLPLGFKLAVSRYDWCSGFTLLPIQKKLNFQTLTKLSIEFALKRF